MIQVPAFPEELLQLIFSNFERTELHDWDQRAKRQTLRTICLVNKQCYRLVQPMLFATIDIQEGNGVVRKLLETVVREPRLASLISILRIESWRGFREEHVMGEEEAKYLRDTAVPRPTLLPLLADVSAVLGNDVAEQLLAHAAQGPEDGTQDFEDGTRASEDTSLSLLLTLCRRLTHLALTIPHDYGSSELCHVLRNIVQRSVGAFPLLQKLTVEHWDTEGSADMEEVAGLLSLPSLRTFKGHMIGFGYSAGRNRYPKLPITGLLDIQLTYTLIDARGIKNLLLSSPCIETLSIEWGDAGVGSCAFTYDEIGDAIRICQINGSLNNLRSLALDDRAAMNDAREDNDDIFPPLGDLRSLSVLQTLDVPQSALLGVDESLDADTEDRSFEMPSLIDILPSSLVRLKVNSSESEGLANLDERILQLATSGKFNHLAELSIVRVPPFSKQEQLEAQGWLSSQKGIPRGEPVMTFTRASSTPPATL